MKKILLLVFLFILVSAFANAQTLEYSGADVLLSPGSADFNMVFIFSDVPKENFYLPLFFHIKDFQYKANFFNYSCRADSVQWGTEINCNLTSVTGGRRTLSFQFQTDELITRIDKGMLFRSSIKMPLETKKLVTKVTLQEGLGLTEETKTLVSYTPKDGKKGSDGRRIYVVWNRKDLEKGEGIDLFVAYESIFPLREDKTPLLFLIGIVGLLILLGLLLKSKKVEVTGLMPDERKIIETLKKYNGRCKQKRIVQETDFSKAKVSRLVNALSERGLLEIEKKGRTNMITLKEPEEK